MPIKKKAEDEVVETPVSSQTDFNVYEGENLIRTYSVEVHGENAKTLAEEFISHHDGTEIR